MKELTTPKILRITSGSAKNKRLAVPEIEHMRPTQEIVKQAIFAIIGDKVIGSTCLDLFAGSGNIGIEALSRGAKSCDFVDNNYKAVQIIEQNLIDCGFNDVAEIHFKDSLKFIARAQEQQASYDLIFIDPFYSDLAQKHLIKSVYNLKAKGGYVIFLYGEQQNVEELIKNTEFALETKRSFGATTFAILR